VVKLVAVRLFLFHSSFVPSLQTVLAPYLSLCLDGMSFYRFDRSALDDAALLGGVTWGPTTHTSIDHTIHVSRSSLCNSLRLYGPNICIPGFLLSEFGLPVPPYIILTTLLSWLLHIQNQASFFLLCRLFSTAHSRFHSFKITCCICMVPGFSLLSPSVASHSILHLVEELKDQNSDRFFFHSAV